MMKREGKVHYPGHQQKLDSPGHRIPGDQGHHEEKSRSFSKSLTPKHKHYIGTLNVNTLMKLGKLKQLTDTMDRFQIKILALQETRFTEENHFDSEGYRIYKGKPAVRIERGPKQFGTAFAVHHSIKDSVINFSSTTERISTLSIKSANKAYTFINAHAPTNDHHRKAPEVLEDFWEQMEEAVNRIPKHHVKVLMGDFNAQLGKEKKHRKITGIHTAHNRTNKNGEKLVNFCSNFGLKIMSTQFEKPSKKLKTWISPNLGLGEFQIDHIAISKESQKEILNVRTRKGFFESDHHLLQVKIKIKPNRKDTRKSHKSSRVDPEHLKKNKTQIVEEIKKEETSETWTQLAQKIRKATTAGQPPRKRKHRWWNSTCDQAIEKRIKAWKDFESKKTRNKWENFVKIRKQSSKIIRKEKRNYDKQRLEEIERDFTKNNTRNFYQTFRENLSGYQPPSLCFKKPDGSLETNTKNNCKILAKYFEKLLNCEPPRDNFHFDTTEPNENSQPPTLNETKEIIRSLKNNKAPGEDGIIAEFWKLDETLAPKIHKILLEIWETETIPSEWTSALIHPLHKKSDKTDPNNYRGISLLPVTYKILSKALLTRLEEQMDKEIGEYQAGFRKGRSCAEQIWNLKIILQIRKSRNTVITFVDFKKAYDSIDRKTLFKTLEEFGTDRKTLNIIKQTLTNTTSKVKFMGEISKPFEIKTGVRQGDGLSPLLFNIVLEKIIREWQKEVKGINIGRKLTEKINIKCLAFADDLAILTNNRAEAKTALEKLHKIAAKTGLQISYEKTQYMERTPENNQPIRTQQGEIAQVTHFKYLGEMIQPTGLNTIANKERAKKLQKAYKITWNHYNKKCISINAKLRHYNTVVLPEATYAAETTLIEGHSGIRELEKIERKIIRKILGAVQRNGIWIKRPSAEIYNWIEPISKVFRKKRATFYGHLYRMNNNRLTKKIFNLTNTKVKKTNWTTEVKQDLKQLQITEETIKERNEFRRLITDGSLDESKKKKNVKLTDEQRQRISDRMKRFWEDRKNKKKK